MTHTPKEIQEFLSLNRWAKNYSYYIKLQEGGYNPYLTKKPIILEDQSTFIIEQAKKDLTIIKTRSKAFDLVEGPRIGDFIQLPDKTYTQVTHVWYETVQTGGPGSKYLGNGYISRSGGLDPGLKISDLAPTDKTKKCSIWIFQGNHAEGHNGINYKIPFRVYKTKKGADLSGVPQIAERKKELKRAKAEKITRINENGQPYTLPLPEITILEPHAAYKDKAAQKENFFLCGIKFKPNHWGTITGQPMKLSQIENLLNSFNFSGTYYNNGSHKNALFLKNQAQNKHDKIYTIQNLIK